jgi:GntR family transcriptional regulator/MocR family aminotransferase
MPIEWSGFGPNLLLPLDRDSGRGLRAQLEEGLRDAIRTGRLRVGERLPSSRQLAGAMGISRGIVQDCYEQLRAEGYLESRAGSATRVAAAAYPVPAPPAPAAVPAPRLIADFRPAVPDLGSFPRTDWVWATREACRALATADLGYGDPRGHAVLREVLAGYLRRVRAAAVDPDRIVVCTGFAQGLGLVVRALGRTGTRLVAVEDPGFGDPAASESVRGIQAAGLRVVPVPVDEHGIDVAALRRSGADVVVVGPAHQSPTGVVLSPQRRHELVDWAKDGDRYVVEDDYDSEFRYDREPVGVVQGLAPDHVFLIGTASKSLAPAVRLGWIVTPARFTEPVALEKLISDRGTSGLDQHAFARLMESGRYDRHLRRMRAVYARRRDLLVTTLRRYAPGVGLSGLAAGFHAVAHLPAGTAEADVIDAALERGVGLYGMSAFRADRATEPTQLVLGFGNLGERAIEPGIAAIAPLLRAPR